jgi:hypothetical protein
MYAAWRLVQLGELDHPWLDTVNSTFTAAALPLCQTSEFDNKR